MAVLTAVGTPSYIYFVSHCAHARNIHIYTGRSIMFSMITNIYNKKTKGPTLMEFFTATGKLKKFFFDNQICPMCAPWVTWHTLIQYSSSCHTHVTTLTCVWQELEYRIDVCHVTRGAHIEHL